MIMLWVYGRGGDWWWSSNFFRETQWSTNPFEEEFASLNLCALSLPFTTTYLHVFKQPTVPLESNVYVTLTTLWKFFHYSPNRAECLKEVQRVLNMPELKVIKHYWLAHEQRCQSSEGELHWHFGCSQQHLKKHTSQKALGISKALSSKSTVSAVYLLDHVLPQVAKLLGTPSI